MNGRPFYQAEVQSGADETHIALSLAERLKTGREEYRAYMDEDTARGVSDNQEKLQEIVSDSNSYLASQAFRPDQSNLMSKEAMSYVRLLEVLKLSQPEASLAPTDILKVEHSTTCPRHILTREMIRIGKSEVLLKS